MANQDADRSRSRDNAHAPPEPPPGLIARVTERSREAVEGIRLPRADWRTFGWGLLILIILAFIVRNWARSASVSSAGT